MTPQQRSATAVGYVRVSTAEQTESGLGLAAQRRTIEAECDRRGWTLVAVYEDSASGKSMAGRGALAEGLEALDRGDAGALVVSKLDRLSRSVGDAAELLNRAQRAGWALVACDLGVDTTTPAGEAMANVMATFAQLERRLIGQRTRDALAIAKASGVRLGRPPVLPDEVRSRIVVAHQAGDGWSTIAAALNDEAIPTARGTGPWLPATVRKIFLTETSSPDAGQQTTKPRRTKP